ncbi:hypothetical protein GCWU000322_00081 [Eubacterium saphenum ATCC 49989]|nr:hypothetical protein GCWU000322_00081 [Eubacterium saphenum ATCC 49989]
MLTLDEFKQITGKELAEAEFNRLLKSSLVLIGAKTLHRFPAYYAGATGTALEACRVCLAEVIKYHAELDGAKADEPSGKWVKAETVGNHRVEYADGGKLDGSGATTSKEVDTLVRQYLEPLGLTYRGVGLC